MENQFTKIKVILYTFEINIPNRIKKDLILYEGLQKTYYFSKN